MSSDTEELDDDEALPSDMVLFTAQEGDMMKEIFKLFGLSPRCLKRIINVFKLLKVIWKRDSTRYAKEESDEDVHHMQRATLFLMLLASDESMRDVTYMIFDWMESGTVMYHHVAVSNEKGALQNVNNLARLFYTELKNRDNSFDLSFSKIIYSNKKKGIIQAATKQGTLMFSLEKYLTRYEWKSFDEWNEISSKFLLARCFSFFRLVIDEIDNEKQAVVNDNHLHQKFTRSHYNYGT